MNLRGGSTQNYERPRQGLEARFEAEEILRMSSKGDTRRAIALLLEARQTVLSRNQILSFKPHKKQLEFFVLGNRKVRRAFFGGNRTGKTVCGAAEVAYHATGMYPDWWPGFRFDRPPLIWCSGTSLDKTVEGVQTMLLGPPSNIGVGFIPGHRIVRTDKMQNTTSGIAKAYIAWGEDKSEVATIVFKSYEQGRKKFETDQVQLIWLDEEPPLDIYRECQVRLLGNRSRAGGKMILTFTPLLGMTDVCREFLRPAAMGISADEKTSGNGTVVASWEDNEFLNAEEVEELRNATPEYEREAREHGRPVMGSGKIYPIVESAYSVPFFEIPVGQGWKFAIGLDHGWDHPAALCFYAMEPNSGDAYLYRTWRGKKQLIPVVAQIIKDEFARIGGAVPIFADPSGLAERQDNGGKSIFAQYADCGVNLIAADNQVESGLIEMFTGLQSARIKVFHGAPCVHWWEEVRLYHRNDLLKVVKDEDDVMDAARYPIRHRLQWMTPQRQRSSHIMRNRREVRANASWKARR